MLSFIMIKKIFHCEGAVKFLFIRKPDVMLQDSDENLKRKKDNKTMVKFCRKFFLIKSPLKKKKAKIFVL
jgi:hypothetical protein